MPSLFLLLSFENFLNQIKHGVKRSNVIKNIEQLTSELNIKRTELDTSTEQQQAELDALVQAKQSEVDTLTQQADTLTQDIKQAKATLKQLQTKIEQIKGVQSSNIA